MNFSEAEQRICNFFDQAGIPYEKRELQQETFLPGVALEEGKLLYDPEKLKYPGDLLHEAGHYALSVPEEREHLHGDMAKEFPHKEQEEMAVMCWSFIASKVCGIPAEDLFHEGGYKGQAQELCMSFESGNLIGLPLLEWMDMFKREPDGRVTVLNWLRPQPREIPEQN